VLIDKGKQSFQLWDLSATPPLDSSPRACFWIVTLILAMILTPEFSKPHHREDFLVIMLEISKNVE